MSFKFSIQIEKVYFFFHSMSNQAESIQDNLNVMKCIHQIILDFVDDKIDLQSLLNNFANQKIREKSRDLRYLLHILAKIANNHNRSHNMIGKIEQILIELQEDIKKNFQKIEIFDFFKGNKVILLFLFKQNIISPDKYIFDYITDDYYISQNYPQFFYSEFSSFFSKELKEKINKNGQIQIPTNELKDQDREVGENTFDLCELIRKDNVSEFESFIQSKSYSPSTQIPKSIYETNSPIVNKKLTLIEYSCFCGSNQIFQYLKEKVARLISGLWSYAVHGNNLEIIKTLEENNVQPPNSSYKKFYAITMSLQNI